MSAQPWKAADPGRCEGCGTELAEVCFSEHLDAWLCLGCFFRPIDPSRPLDPPSLPTAPVDDYGSMGLGPVGPVRSSVATTGPGELDTAARSRALDVVAPLGETFPCVLPGHDDTGRIHPTKAPGRPWRYRCEGAALGLAEVRAATAYGRVRGGISGIEVALWRARLDKEAGLLEPRPVLIALPPTVLDATRKVALGLQLYLGLRDPAKLGGERSFTWARPFVMAWCGVSDQQAREAVWQLRCHGVLEPGVDLTADEKRNLAKAGRAILYRAGPQVRGGVA